MRLYRKNRVQRHSRSNNHPPRRCCRRRIVRRSDRTEIHRSTNFQFWLTRHLHQKATLTKVHENSAIMVDFYIVSGNYLPLPTPSAVSPSVRNSFLSAVGVGEVFVGQPATECDKIGPHSLTISDWIGSLVRSSRRTKLKHFGEFRTAQHRRFSANLYRRSRSRSTRLRRQFPGVTAPSYGPSSYSRSRRGPHP